MIDFVLYVILIDMVFLKVCVIFLSYFLPVWIRICIRIRSHMDNFGILALDPDSWKTYADPILCYQWKFNCN